MMRTLVPWCLAAAATAGGVWLTLDQRRLASEAGTMQLELAEARLAVEAAR